MKIKKSIAVIMVLAAMASCNHESNLDVKTNPTDNSGNNGGNGGNNGGNNISCNPDTVYFNKDILPLLSSNCAITGCHDSKTAEEGVVLDNYSNIIRTGKIMAGNPGESELYEAITESDPEDIMPPAPKSKLTGAQIQLIRKWIMQGAKNNYCSSCDSSQFKFATDIMPIIQQNCTGCHSGSSPSKGVYLVNYNDIKTVANSGKLSSVVKWNGAIKMPTSYKLDDCQIKKLEKWISNGAPND